MPAVSLHGAAGTTFPHSSYLGTLAEDGLLGFVPLLLMTFATWLFVHRLRKTFPDGEAAVWAAAVTAASLSYFFVSLSLTMLPYGPANAVLAAVLGAAAGRVVALERGESADEDDIEDDAMTQSDVAPSAIGAA